MYNLPIEFKWLIADVITSFGLSEHNELYEAISIDYARPDIYDQATAVRSFSPAAMHCRLLTRSRFQPANAAGIPSLQDRQRRATIIQRPSLLD